MSQDHLLPHRALLAVFPDPASSLKPQAGVTVQGRVLARCILEIQPSGYQRPQAREGSIPDVLPAPAS